MLASRLVEMELDLNLVGCEVISPTIPNDTQLTVGSTQRKVMSVFSMKIRGLDVKGHCKEGILDLCAHSVNREFTYEFSDVLKVIMSPYKMWKIM